MDFLATPISRPLTTPTPTMESQDPFPYTFPPPTPYHPAKRPFHLLVALTGSVAATKLPLLLETLNKTFTTAEMRIHVLLSDSAMHFVPPVEEIAKMSALLERVWTDSSDFSTWTKIGDPVLHIELRKWADLLLVAPLGANSLASFSLGLCKGIVQNCFRAWDFKATSKGEKRVVCAPAMNTAMWEAPITSAQIKTLESWGVRMLEVVGKKLACGDVGLGGMVSVDRLVEVVKEEMQGIQKACENTDKVHDAADIS